MKRMFTLWLILTLLFTTGAQAFGEEKTNVSHWATFHMEQAVTAGFIPASYRTNAKGGITRLEFCKMVVLFYEKATGEKLIPKGESPFEDTKDAAVIAAYEAKIISGVSPGKFAPEGNLTREQLALMLARVLKACGVVLPEATDKAVFTDIAPLYDASIQAINQLQNAKILSGDGNGVFAPFRQLTVQEAVVSFMKTLDYYEMKKTEALPKEEAVPEQTASEKEEKPVVEETPKAEDTSLATQAQKGAHILNIGEKSVALGQTMEEVTKIWGNPDRIDETVYGLKRYVYVGDYKTYFFVTFENNKSIEIFMPGNGFSHMGNLGSGTVADIKGVTRISELEHSAMILGEETQARIPLDYEGNISGILLQTNDFATKAQIKSGIHLSLRQSIEAELLDIIQVKRVAEGLTLLKVDERLTGVASEHCKDMAKNGYMSYTGLNGSTPFSRISERGITFKTASEVIAKKRGDTVNIYQEWVKTPATIGGILNATMEHCGVGVEQKNQELYVTVDLCGGLGYL